MASIAYFKYFAFGSNLLQQRLQIKNPDSKFVCTAKLNDYSLNFGNATNEKNQHWLGGTATIVKTPGDTVWGIVYEVNEKHRESLDAQESLYNGIEVTVEAENGEQHVCRTYIFPQFTHFQPSPQYHNVILNGAKRSKLPEHYIKKLECIETNGNTKLTELMKSVNFNLA